MNTTSTRRRGRSHALVATLPAFGAAAAALLLGQWFPLLSPLLVALLLGAVVANSPLARGRALADQAAPTRLLLRLGVVALGLQLSIVDVMGIGLGGIVVVLGTVAMTYLATLRIGDAMGLERGFVTLLAAGFSICGAAAIAAVEDTARAARREVALAVAMATVFGSLMIVAIPTLAHALDLGAERSAIWAGASIHEVAQVAAAASVLGGGALAVAMTVKLGRVMLLGPVYLLAARRGRTAVSPSDDLDGRAPLVPWFVIGFAAAVALRSTGVLGDTALDVAGLLTTVLLAAGMFGLGAGLRLRELWPVPPRALALAAVSTLVAGGTSLLLVVLLC